MKHAHMVVLLLVGVTSLPAWAADTTSQRGSESVTVEALVRRALADNTELHAARAEIDAAQGRLRQAGLRPNPLVDLGVQQSVSGPDNNLMAGVTVPLDLNGRKAGRVGVATQALEVKRAQVSDRERRLRAEVRMKAGELMAAQRNLQFMRELFQVNQHALELLRARVQQGAVPALEERLLLVEVNRLEASLLVLEGQTEVLALQLKTLVGLDHEVPLVLAEDLHPKPLAVDRKDALPRALSARSDLLVARAEVAMAGAGILKERADGRWDASVNVGYMRQDFGYDLRGLTARGEPQPIHDVFHYVGGGVTVSLPVFNQNQGNIAAAVAESTAAAHRLAFMTTVVRQEVTAAFTQYDAAQRALETYSRGVRSVAQVNLAVVRKAYELGRTSLLDLIAEQRRYIEVETGYTDAVKQVYNAAVDIERAVGALER